MTPLERIELEVLQAIRTATPYPDEIWFIPFRLIERETGYDREIVRGLCRSLCNRGYLQYGNGFDEDGMTAGSGYGLRSDGKRYIITLLAKQEVGQKRRGSVFSGAMYQ